MKEIFVNNVFRFLVYTPWENDIKNNLGTLSSDIILKEFKTVNPLVIELYIYAISFIEFNIKTLNKLDQIYHENILKEFKKELSKINNIDFNNLTEKQILYNYQYLFNQLAWITHYFIKLKNILLYSDYKKMSLLIKVNKVLTKIDYIINLLDHKTSIENKELMSLANHKLIFIKLRTLCSTINSYLDGTMKFIDKDNQKDFLSYSYDVKREIEKLKKEVKKDLVKNKNNIRCLKRIEQILKEVKIRFIQETKTIEPNRKNNYLTILGILLLGKYIIDYAAEIKEKDEIERKAKLEETMDNYMLLDWQKELVRKGEYEPWAFEEEQLEDDDYYFDDID